jgi:hypothetical protein
VLPTKALQQHQQREPTNPALPTFPCPSMARKHIPRAHLNIKKGRVRVVSKDTRKFLGEKQAKIKSLEHKQSFIQRELPLQQALLKRLEATKLKESIERTKARIYILNYWLKHNDTALFDLKDHLNYSRTFVKKLETQERCPIPDLVLERQWQNREKILGKTQTLRLNNRNECHVLPEKTWLSWHYSKIVQYPYYKNPLSHEIPHTIRHYK